jgi:hypothetical protein
LTLIPFTIAECQSRWQVLSRGTKIRGSWLKEEDFRLEELVKKGFKFWREIASHMPGRSSKQCRERWQQNLQPSLLRTPYTAEEDEKIIKLQSELGNKWADIGRQITGRSVSINDAIEINFYKS